MSFNKRVNEAGMFNSVLFLIRTRTKISDEGNLT